jgi:hypothetical protein
LQRLETVAPSTRPIPISFIVLAAFAVHLPLLLMELPLKSYDTNFHIFFASHYVHHWFNPWNAKWYAGFSQTTYPPLPQQWVAVVSRLIGLDLAYMAVQFAAILLLVVGVYRFAGLHLSRLGELSRLFCRSVVNHGGRASLSECAAVHVRLDQERELAFVH